VFKKLLLLSVPFLISCQSGTYLKEPFRTNYYYYCMTNGSKSITACMCYETVVGKKDDLGKVDGTDEVQNQHFSDLFNEVANGDECKEGPVK